jgi:hypothetical protein
MVNFKIATKPARGNHFVGGGSGGPNIRAAEVGPVLVWVSGSLDDAQLSLLEQFLHSGHDPVKSGVGIQTNDATVGKHNVAANLSEVLQLIQADDGVQSVVTSGQPDQDQNVVVVRTGQLGKKGQWVCGDSLLEESRYTQRTGGSQEVSSVHDMLLVRGLLYLEFGELEEAKGHFL